MNNISPNHIQIKMEKICKRLAASHADKVHASCLQDDIHRRLKRRRVQIDNGILQLFNIGMEHRLQNFGFGTLSVLCPHFLHQIQLVSDPVLQRLLKLGIALISKP